jgi:hypothetical protein
MQGIVFDHMVTFLKLNSVAIAREVNKKIQEYNVPQNELLLVIDFFEDAPALRNEFKVGLMFRFLDGSPLVDEPDWIRTDDEIPQMLKESRDCSKDGDDLHALCRFGNGTMTACHFGFSSEKALESIGEKL